MNVLTFNAYRLVLHFHILNKLYQQKQICLCPFRNANDSSPTWDRLHKIPLTFATSWIQMGPIWRPSWTTGSHQPPPRSLSHGSHKEEGRRALSSFVSHSQSQSWFRSVAVFVYYLYRQKKLNRQPWRFLILLLLPLDLIISSPMSITLASIIITIITITIIILRLCSSGASCFLCYLLSLSPLHHRRLLLLPLRRLRHHLPKSPSVNFYSFSIFLFDWFDFNSILIYPLHKKGIFGSGTLS